MGGSVICGMILVIVVCLIQTIGFFTPAWFCNIESKITPTTTIIPRINRNEFSDLHTKYTNEIDTCDMLGLFYPEGIDYDYVFYMSISSMIGVWICTGILLFIALCKSPNENKCVGITCIVLFVMFQVVAGIAGIMCRARYDKVGWSAYMFSAVGVAIVLIIVFIFTICYYGYKCLEKLDICKSFLEKDA